MKQWFALPISVITLSIIVKLADCCEFTRDVLFYEEHLRDKIDTVLNDMDQINANLPILKNTADSEANLLLDQRISLSFPQYFFNKRSIGIKSVVKLMVRSAVWLISKIAPIKFNFLKKFYGTFKNVKVDVNKAVERILDKPVSVDKCVLEQKSAFDNLVKNSLPGAMNCVKKTVRESMMAITEAIRVSTETKALVEDLSKQETGCGNQSGIFKCLLGIFHRSKTSVKLGLVKIKTAVQVAFKTSKEVPLKLIGCQSTIMTDASKIKQNIKQCTKNSVILSGRNLDGDSETPEESTPVSYDEYNPPDLEEYDKEDDYHF